MSHGNPAVFHAIERWEEKGIIPGELAATLRRETEEASEAGTARLSQYLVAAVGAALMLIAVGVFLDWAWPRMTESTRVGFLLGLGLGVHLVGARLEHVRRWIPAALLMQTGGLGVVMAGLIFSDQVWEAGTAGSVGMGITALAVPLVLAPRSFRANAVMPAVHLCFSIGFLAVFMDRTLGLSADAIIWILDGILFAASLAMVLVLRRDPSGERHPWALNAFVAAVYSSAVMVVLTGMGPLDLREETVYGLDAWLFLVAGLTLWGIHRSPQGLRRDWFERQLAYCVLLWIPLGFLTALETLDGPPELALVMVAGVAVAGFAYALRYRIARILATSAITFVAAVWFWAVERGGALGAVAGLAVAAVVFFRLSGRVGRWAGEREEER